MMRCPFYVLALYGAAKDVGVFPVSTYGADLRL
jgi:hypothetical protein